MVAMKRVILLLLFVGAVIFLPFSPPRKVHAEEALQYAVAATPDVWFYSAEDEESGLFLLPYSYYVKVLQRGTVYSAVQYLDDVAPYKSITGYCRTDALTFVNFIPERPYLRCEIKVSYLVDNPSGALMGKGTFDKIEKSFVYYGTSYLGTARYFYVFADGVFDYVPANQEILFEYNTDYLQPSNGETGTAFKDAPQDGLSGIQIALICAAAAGVAIIAAFVLRGKKTFSAPQQEFPEF